MAQGTEDTPCTWRATRFHGTDSVLPERGTEDTARTARQSIRAVKLAQLGD